MTSRVLFSIFIFYITFNSYSAFAVIKNYKEHAVFSDGSTFDATFTFDSISNTFSNISGQLVNPNPALNFSVNTGSQLDKPTLSPQSSGKGVYDKYNSSTIDIIYFYNQSQITPIYNSFNLSSTGILILDRILNAFDPEYTVQYWNTSLKMYIQSLPSQTTLTVLPDIVPIPTVSISAAPNPINSGDTTTLTWQSTNATSCIANDGWNGNKTTTGNVSTGILTSTKTYKLTCTGPGGSVSQSVTVNVNTPPPTPTVSLTTNTSQVNSGSAATLNWSSTNANSCTTSGDWSGTVATSGGVSTGPLTANKTYTLTCTGAGGTVSQSVTVNVNTPPPPTVTLTTNTSQVNSGSAATLNWSSTNANSCLTSGGWGGSVATSGGVSTGPLTANKTFTLSCTGPGGSTSQSLTINVNTPPAPVVSLTSASAQVSFGSSTTLIWSSTNAESCSASGGWSGSVATTGSLSTEPLTASTTYNLVCTGLGGSANQSITVSVNTPPPTVFLTATPSQVNQGNPTVLNWSSTNANSCTASGGWSGTLTTAGSLSTEPLNETKSFQISCVGNGGSVSQSVSVGVNSYIAPTTAINDLVTISYGRLTKKKGVFTLSLKVTNNSQQHIDGPIFLSLNNINPTGLTPVNAEAQTNWILITNKKLKSKKSATKLISFRQADPASVSPADVIKQFNFNGVIFATTSNLLNTSTFSAAPFSEITIPISNRSDAKAKYSVVFHDQTNKLNIEVPAIYVKGSSQLKSMMPPLPVSSNGLSLKSDTKLIKTQENKDKLRALQYLLLTRYQPLFTLEPTPKPWV